MPGFRNLIHVGLEVPHWLVCVLKAVKKRELLDVRPISKEDQATTPRTTHCTHFSALFGCSFRRRAASAVRSLPREVMGAYHLRRRQNRWSYFLCSSRALKVRRMVHSCSRHIRHGLRWDSRSDRISGFPGPVRSLAFDPSSHFRPRSS